MTIEPHSDHEIRRDMDQLTAVLLLTCAEHVPRMEEFLDVSDVLSWTVLPAVQSRRLGFLQNLPRRDRRTCNVIIAFGAEACIQRAVSLIRAARDHHELCPECAIFRWPVERLAKLPLQLDPVCDEAVDSSHSLTCRYRNQAFYFCSEACRDVFIANPAGYLERRDSPYRVDRRDLQHSGRDFAATNSGENSDGKHSENIVSGRL